MAEPYATPKRREPNSIGSVLHRRAWVRCLRLPKFKLRHRAGSIGDIVGNRVKTWFEYVGGALALLVGCWALYVEIASNGNDPTVMRWFGAAIALAFVIAVVVWLIGKPSSS